MRSDSAIRGVAHFIEVDLDEHWVSQELAWLELVLTLLGDDSTDEAG